MAKEKIQELEIPQELTVLPQDILLTSTIPLVAPSVLPPANNPQVDTDSDSEKTGDSELEGGFSHEGAVFTNMLSAISQQEEGIKKLPKDLEAKDSALRELTKELEVTKSALKEFDEWSDQKYVEGLLNDAKSRNNRILELEGAEKKKDEEISSLISKNAELEAQVNAFTEEREQNEQIKANFSTLYETKTSLDAANKKLTEENEGLRAKIEHEKELSSKAVEMLKRDIEGVKAELEQTKESHNQYLSYTQAVMDERLSAIQDLGTTAKKKDEEISSLKSKNEELEVNNNKFKKLLDEVLEETATLKKELSDKNASIEVLEQTIKQHQENFAQERQRNTELETKLTEAQASVSKLEAETKEPRAEPLTEDLKNKLSGFQRLSAGFDELEKQKNNLLQENKDLKAQIRKFEELQRENEQLKKQLAERAPEVPPVPAAEVPAPAANNDAPAPQAKGSWSNSVLNFLSTHKTQAGAGFGIALSATSLYLGGGNPKDGLGQILSYSVDALKGIGSLLISAPMKLAEGIGSMLGRS